MAPVTGDDVKYEAVQFGGAGAPATVSVSGAFPSSATVIVTDEDFHVVQVARTTDAGEASVRVPAGSGGRFVLVRDLKWVKPMTFHVNVAR